MNFDSLDDFSICKAGNGIFGTHVTWQDIEYNMQTSLGTKATFGPNKTVKNIGDGKGFISKICLIEADWKNAGADEILPEKFVAKLCTIYTMVSFAQKNIEEGNGDPAVFKTMIERFVKAEKDIYKFHNSECDAFMLFSKYGVADRVKMPKFYYAQKFTDEKKGKGHIIMEAMEDLHPIHIIDNLPVEAIKKVLRCLAVMQATSLCFTEEEKMLFPTRPFEHIYSKWVEGDTKHTYSTALKACGEPGQLDELLSRLEPYLEQIKQFHMHEDIPLKLGMQPVLCHGDLWSTNKIWRKFEDEYTLAAILDYQAVNFGAPGVDLTRLFITTLSGKMRREHFDELIETFYEYLLEELAGKEAPYTLEQLKLNYELYFPASAYLVFSILNGQVIEAAAKNCSSSETQVKALIAEKVQCILEDTIHYFEKHQMK